MTLLVTLLNKGAQEVIAKVDKLNASSWNSEIAANNSQPRKVHNKMKCKLMSCRYSKQAGNVSRPHTQLSYPKTYTNSPNLDQRKSMSKSINQSMSDERSVALNTKDYQTLTCDYKVS